MLLSYLRPFLRIASLLTFLSLPSLSLCLSDTVYVVKIEPNDGQTQFPKNITSLYILPNTLRDPRTSIERGVDVSPSVSNAQKFTARRNVSDGTIELVAFPQNASTAERIFCITAATGPSTIGDAYMFRLLALPYDPNSEFRNRVPPDGFMKWKRNMELSGGIMSVEPVVPGQLVVVAVGGSIIPLMWKPNYMEETGSQDLRSIRPQFRKVRFRLLQVPENDSSAPSQAPSTTLEPAGRPPLTLSSPSTTNVVYDTTFLEVQQSTTKAQAPALAGSPKVPAWTTNFEDAEPTPFDAFTTSLSEASGTSMLTTSATGTGQSNQSLIDTQWMPQPTYPSPVHPNPSLISSNSLSPHSSSPTATATVSNQTSELSSTSRPGLGPSQSASASPDFDPFSGQATERPRPSQTSDQSSVDMPQETATPPWSRPVPTSAPAAQSTGTFSESSQAAGTNAGLPMITVTVTLSDWPPTTMSADSTPAPGQPFLSPVKPRPEISKESEQWTAKASSNTSEIPSQPTPVATSVQPTSQSSTSSRRTTSSPAATSIESPSLPSPPSPPSPPTTTSRHPTSKSWTEVDLEPTASLTSSRSPRPPTSLTSSASATISRTSTLVQPPWGEVPRSTASRPTARSNSSTNLSSSSSLRSSTSTTAASQSKPSVKGVPQKPSPMAPKPIASPPKPSASTPLGWASGNVRLSLTGQRLDFIFGEGRNGRGR